MQREEILKEFEEADAILKGHFVLSSGLHSDTYLQCARVLMEGARAGRLCRALAEKVQKALGEDAADIVVSPAMGGVVAGYEMGRQLGLPAIFCEREDGAFALRRGFSLEPGMRALVVEDVVTTGKSSRETFDCIEKHGGRVVGEACLVNRSGSADPLGGVPLVALIDLDVKTYRADALPDALKAIPAVKPGSRWLKSNP